MVRLSRSRLQMQKGKKVWPLSYVVVSAGRRPAAGLAWLSMTKKRSSWKRSRWRKGVTGRRKILQANVGAGPAQRPDPSRSQRFFTTLASPSQPLCVLSLRSTLRRVLCMSLAEWRANLESLQGKPRNFISFVTHIGTEPRRTNVLGVEQGSWCQRRMVSQGMSWSWSMKAQPITPRMNVRSGERWHGGSVKLLFDRKTSAQQQSRRR